VSRFVSDLALIARPAGGGSHAFMGEDGSCRGFIQIIWNSGSEIVIPLRLVEFDLYDSVMKDDTE
jgi:hypothetical protein